MPKKISDKLDGVDIDILCTLYFLGEATATELEKFLEISRATISDRLKRMVEKGVLKEPRIDISTGRLRKLYQPPPVDELKKIVIEFLSGELDENEDINEILNALFEEVFESLEADKVKRLREGASINELEDILEEYGNVRALFIFIEILGVLDREGDIIRLNERGFKWLVKLWKERVEIYLNDLRKVDKSAYNSILKKYCQ